MNLLAIETSGETCSVALLNGEDVFERVEKRPKMQASVILSMISGLLKEHAVTLKELKYVAFGQGPGSFTGVRIAASVAQGLAMGANLPIVPVPSLLAIAHRVKGDKPIVVAIDARKAEVYTATFTCQNDELNFVRPIEVVGPKDLTLKAEIDEFIACGNGWDIYRKDFNESVLAKASCFKPELCARASDVAHLAKTMKAVAIEEALPLYVRDKVTD